MICTFRLLLPSFVRSLHPLTFIFTFTTFNFLCLKVGKKLILKNLFPRKIFFMEIFFMKIFFNFFFEKTLIGRFWFLNYNTSIFMIKKYGFSVMIFEREGQGTIVFEFYQSKMHFALNSMNHKYVDRDMVR